MSAIGRDVASIKWLFLSKSYSLISAIPAAGSNSFFKCAGLSVNTGRLSDSIGRKTLVLLSCAGFIIFTFPLFALLAAIPTLTTYLFVQFAGAVLYGLVFGVLPTLLAELFPTNVRYTGISI